MTTHWLSTRSLHRRVAIVAALLCTAMLMSACGESTDGGDAGPTSAASKGGETPGPTEDADTPAEASLRVAWYGPQTRYEVTKAALDAVTADQAAIKITMEFASEDAYWKKLATQSAGDNTPDIMQQHTQYIADYAQRGVLYDLSALDDVHTNDIPQPLLKIGTMDGKLVGIPNGITAHALMYNADMLESTGVAAPDWGWTWDNFEIFLKSIQAELPPKQYASEDFGGYDSPLMQYARGIGKSLYTPDGKLGINADDLKAWYTMWNQLRDEGLVPPADVTAGDDGSVANGEFAKGRAVIEYRAANQSASLAQSLGISVGLLPFPSADGSVPAYPIPTGFWSISANTRNAEAAGKVVDYLLNDPTAGKLQGLERGLPPNTKVMDELKGNFNDAEKAQSEFLSKVIETGGPAESARPAGSGQITDILRRSYEGYAFGTMSLDDAVSQFMSEANEALS